MDIVEQLNKSIANLREAGFNPTLLEVARDEIRSNHAALRALYRENEDLENRLEGIIEQHRELAYGAASGLEF